MSEGRGDCSGLFVWVARQLILLGHVRNRIRESPARRPIRRFSCHPVQERLSHHLNKRSHPPRPVRTERTRRITRRATHDQQRTLADPKINVRIDVLLVHEDWMNNLLCDISPDDGMRRPEPAKCVRARQPAAAFSLGERYYLLDGLLHERLEIFSRQETLDPAQQPRIINAALQRIT